MKYYILLLLCLMQFACFSQSLHEESQKFNNSDTSYNRLPQRDSGYSRVEFRNNQLELKKLVDNMNEQDKKEQRRTYTRITLAAILLIIIVIAIIRLVQNRKAGN